MSSYNKFNSFVEALAEKVHNLGSDQFKIALCAAANAPVAANTKLSDLTVITANFTGVNPLNIVTTSSAQTAGTYKLVVEDLTVTADTGGNPAFRYIVIYNDTATNKELVGFFDYGSEVTLAATDQFIFNFDQSAGVLTLV
jgi:hypothetical protein